MARVANNNTAKECLELEKRNVSLEELMPVIKGDRGGIAYKSGDINAGLFPIGNAIGIINDIPSVKELIDRTIKEFEEAVNRLNSITL